jgi:uncharacterized protein GlcG (DUF336 family)
VTNLTRDRARNILDAAMTAGTAEGLRLSAAVTDAGGHLLAFDRTENANLATIDIAVQKARTAVYFQLPTRHLTAAMQPGGPLYTAQHTSGGLSAIPGGVPITDEDGTLIGAIGISGGSGAQDDSIAVTAAETLDARATS